MKTHIRVIVKVLNGFWQPCIYASNVDGQALTAIRTAVGVLAGLGVPIFCQVGP